jgi:hypothetical protein
MDNETIRNGLMLLQWLTTCALAWYAHNIGKQKATTDSIKVLEKQLADKCVRLAELRGEIAKMPVRDELTRLHERIDELLETNRTNNLLLGELIGQMREISKHQNRNHP